MSRAVAAIRVLGLLWLIPLEVLAIIIYRSGSFPVEEGYAPAEQALGSESFTLCIPLVSLAAAIAANTIQRSGFLDRPNSRPPMLVFGPPLLGIFAPSALTAVATQLLALRGASEPAVNPGLLLTPVVWAGAATLFGWLSGSRMALKYAAPVSVLIPYLFVGFPPAMDPAWLQHTIGLSTLCCRVNEVPSWRPGVAALLLAGGTSLAMWVALTNKLTRSTSLVAIAGVVAPMALVGLSGLTALPLEYRATSPRDPGQRTCKNFGVEVCYWPEHAQEIEASEAKIRAVVDTAQKNGLMTPESLVEAPETEVSWPSAPLVVREGDSPSTVQWSVAASLMPIPSTSCQSKIATSGTGKSSRTYEAGAEVMSMRVSELAGDPIPPEMLSSDTPAIVKKLRADPDGGASRLREAQELVRNCSSDRQVL